MWVLRLHDWTRAGMASQGSDSECLTLILYLSVVTFAQAGELHGRQSYNLTLLAQEELLAQLRLRSSQACLRVAKCEKPKKHRGRRDLGPSLGSSC